MEEENNSNSEIELTEEHETKLNEPLIQNVNNKNF